ncbi:non-specific lipid-transfer protein 8 [Carica papaya]|uniref:non-specific lipid-transfer protein 8 n=1 Tax=Carica papaya TaxID=3649 RepID=UPI000B8CFDC1|nr:non-specific lipid-transfer protein 8 [Carica papaya]
MNSLRTKMPAMAMLMLLLILSSSSEAAISCTVVIKDLRPCLNYLVKGSGKPPSACCVGASALASATTTSADKKAACECIKAEAKKVNLNAQLAKDLPANCGITLSVSVSPDVDCSKVG